jgi:hypothetical protein
MLTGNIGGSGGYTIKKGILGADIINGTTRSLFDKTLTEY